VNATVDFYGTFKYFNVSSTVHLTKTPRKLLTPLILVNVSAKQGLLGIVIKMFV
jgi:hypothetical protein